MKNILLIDDDITSLDIVSFFFEEKGFNVQRYTSGHDAIDFVKSSSPDLIVVDLLMPEINGVETVKEIRGLGLSEIPIIAFTAVDDVMMHEEAKEAGCNIVLTKPCPTERLLKHIEGLLAA